MDVARLVIIIIQPTGSVAGGFSQTPAYGPALHPPAEKLLSEHHSLAALPIAKADYVFMLIVTFLMANNFILAITCLSNVSTKCH